MSGGKIIDGLREAIDWSQVQSPTGLQKARAVERQNSVRRALRDQFIVQRNPATGVPVRLVVFPKGAI